MGNLFKVSRPERDREPKGPLTERLQAFETANLESGRRIACAPVTTPRVTWRGYKITLASGPALLGSTWTMWALGCGTFVYATPLEPAPRPLVRRPPESVQVFAGASPSEPHVRVALLEVEQERGGGRLGTEHIIQRLREKAGELGCDAVFVEDTREPTGADGSLERLAHNAQRLLASCLVYSMASLPRPTRRAVD